MAQLKITLTRPSTDVAWYSATEEEKTYISDNYSDLKKSFFDIVSGSYIVPEPYNDVDSLTAVRYRSGSLDLINAFINDINDTNNILNNRKQYWDNNNITYDFEIT